ncbi:S26 family signal peptidase [Cellulosimicrobium arenosum]|uniref:S26 family signal peptidase n=1 Tax=Cellulosimicrobium arenosum TaxID=2708133 RepID=A0A927G7Z7_9MICO|nr:S26 family signal peptidase [Cellulosimicrobium arenosum]MBD8078586.1 S26 family signal peptidase [Cellulosimicrobium arenosum]
MRPVRRRPAAPVRRSAVVLALVALAVVPPVVARRRLLVVTVSGASMGPTYAPGTRVLVVRGRRACPGDVVVLDAERVSPAPPGIPARPGGLVVKRVAAGPGHPVPAQVHDVVQAGPGDVVPTGRVVVLGDAPAASVDSRLWGYVRADAVVGRVVTVLRRGAVQE